MNPIVIIGTGLAGYSVAREFRKLDKTTPLLIITADDGGFYSKPMLSNAFAQNKQARDLISQSAEQMAAQVSATLLTKMTVDHIDTAAKTVVTKAGKFEYSQLVIALGAQAIRLPIAGNAAHQVLSVNNITDYTALRDKMTSKGEKASVVILGAGLIGCEFADDLASAGHAVTLVDPNVLPLAALAPQAISEGLQTALLQRGIRLELGTTASSVDALVTNMAESDALQVSLANGKQIQADIVLSAVGLRPDLRLASASNINTDRGILIDVYGLTSADNVFALGDCAQYSMGNGVQQVLPYIAPIMTAARAIARSLTGESTSIDLKPAPVIVKTPSYPVALIPPAPHAVANGRWETEKEEATTISRFYDSGNRLSGFGVAPQDNKLRTRLLAELAAVNAPAV
ncbi:FAD-dependent oxidoreductase [Undibacterium sp. RTI2.1]|uniref:FAD-dependent oxidoreductase n=1 Tax=unclassified Undibacterium TaxID=2630295 RepID=UPI002AB38AB3|nr:MULTISPECIES: FAD-dependent oxidoreductase [unclassified Undibacterium]MDY7538466.1 FAD-dependent oxidoreductase [Undibacterium sp. 5I1]MEB0030007.1 FAD-dependent oxidoreductase [Undibacterium sp. RTI2.1]MEB0114910.1 FAD-dependent oxidoreductase [Undibacterium sp. RTI2.2]MEB0230632.1 FAD-dependent oxidoreductase [Undibacterium sp. 10I3]MEB0255869.1 FAD-dependent oxidoreductase [Undibacterium sp. 5I1]